MTAASERELQRELRAFAKTLTPEQWAPFDEYLAEQEPMKEKVREYVRGFYLIDLQHYGRDYGRAWLEQHRASDREREERAAKADAERSARKAAAAVAGAALREARDRELAEAFAYALRGEPIPLHLRKNSRDCLNCGRELIDDESVRIGLGPDCLESIARKAGVDLKHLRKTFIAESTGAGLFRLVKTGGEAQR